VSIRAVLFTSFLKFVSIQEAGNDGRGILTHEAPLMGSGHAGEIGLLADRMHRSQQALPRGYLMPFLAVRNRRRNAASKYLT
jgi:hypothetical protein